MKRDSSKPMFLSALATATTLGTILLFTLPGIADNADNLQLSPKPNEPELLKCKRVHPRFSVCGDTNFKNRVVGGFGIHFSVMNPNGQLTAVGRRHAITNQDQSCHSLMSEKSVPHEIRRNAIAVCKDMIREHQMKQES